MTDMPTRKSRASTRVCWVMMFAGRGLADVVRYDRHDNLEWAVRVHGACVDAREAKRIALLFRAGKPLPVGVEAFGEITDD